MESAKRYAAAAQGAIEGFVQALDEYHLQEEAKVAIQEAGAIARAATEEGRAQAQTPEMRELGHDLQRAGHATADAARHVGTATAERARHMKDVTAQRAASANDAVRDTAHNAAQNVREKVENAQYAAGRMKEEVKVRADAVAESGRRARVAPRRIGHELKAGASAYTRGLFRSLAMMAGVGLVALTAWIVLTVGLVAVLAPFIGVGLAAILVAVVYLLGAWGLKVAASKARAQGRKDLREHVENSKEEARYVARPVRNAFGRGRTGI